MPYPHGCAVPIGGNVMFAAPGLPVRVERVPLGQAVTCGTLLRGCRSPGAEA